MSECVKKVMFLALFVSTLVGYDGAWGYGESQGGLNSVKWDSSDVERVGYWPYGPPRRVLAEGDHVYVGMGGGIWVFDVSDPGSPVVVGEVPVSDLVEDMCYRDGLLCVACGYGGICVVDVSEPTRPEVRGRYIDGTRFRKVRVWDSYLIADAPYAVTFYDISDPDTVRLVCGYDYQDLGKILGVVDSILIVWKNTYPFQGLIILSIQDPESLVVLDSVHTGGSKSDMVYRDGYIYVSGMYGVAVVNVVNPESAYVTATSLHGPTDDVELAGDFLYCLGSNTRLYIFNVLDPETLALVGTVSDLGRRMSLAGDYLYVVTDSLFKVVDCSDPVNPMVVYEKLDCPGPGYGLDVEGRYAYYGCGRGGVYILDVRNSMDVREVSHIGGVYARQVMVDSVRGRMYVVVDGEGGLKRLEIYDVSDVVSPVELSEVELGVDSSVDVEVWDTLIFVAMGRSMRVFGVRDPYNPVVLGELEGDTGVVEVEVRDTGVVYVLWEDDTLYVVDVRDVSEPEVLARYYMTDLTCGSKYLRNMLSWRGYLFIDGFFSNPSPPGYSGFIIDFRDINAPGLVDWWTSGPRFIGEGKLCQVYDHCLWLYAVEEGNMSGLELLGRYCMDYTWFMGGEIKNGLIYVNSGRRGLQIFHYVYDTVGVREEDYVGRSSDPSDLLVLKGGVGKLFLDLPSSGYVRVEAYDVVGRYVGEVYRGYLSGGQRDVKVDLSGLRSGVYFLKVEGPGIDEMRRALLVR